MKAVVRLVMRGHAEVALEEIDITNNPELLDQYGLEIPVLMIDGKKAAKYRVTEVELTRMLEARGKG
jgi:hypothetical protein